MARISQMVLQEETERTEFLLLNVQSNMTAEAFHVRVVATRIRFKQAPKRQYHGA